VTLRRVFTGLGAAVIALFFVPVLWIVSVSVREPADTLSRRFWTAPTLDNYRAVLTDDPAFLLGLANSAQVAAGSTVLALACGVPAAYALARFRFDGRAAFWRFVLSTRVAPPAALVIPYYVLYFELGLLDTLTGLVLLHGAANTSLVIWMLRGFFEDVPVELEEAARLDGAGRVRTFFHVTLPLAAPGVAATTIVALLASWNEFLFATMLTGSDTRTAPAAIAQYVTFRAVVWGKLAAASVLTAVPIVIFVALVQRHLALGLRAGGGPGARA
jgi:multiple sugar transport system permease protein